MRKRIWILAMLFGICASAVMGCANKEETITEPTQQETLSENTEEMDPEMEAEEQKEWAERQYETKLSASVWEDADSVYFLGRQLITKWNKEARTSTIIWMTDKEEIRESEYAYKNGSGILVGDKIYFMEEWEDTDSEGALQTLLSLSVVNTDGSGYREVAQAQSKDHLVLLSGILYYDYDWNTRQSTGYVLNENNEPISEEAIVNEPVNVPKEYTEGSYYKNGVHQLSSLESVEHFGCYLLRDEEYRFCIVEQNTGEKVELPEEYQNLQLVSWNEEFLLLKDYANGKWYLFSLADREIQLLIEQTAECSVIDMNEEYLYWQREYVTDGSLQYIYERVDLTDKTAEELFVLDSFVGLQERSSWYLMDISLVNDYIYYVGEQEYTCCLMRRNVNMPNAEEVVIDAFYDTGIGAVGSVEAYKEQIYSQADPSVMIGELDLERLVIKDTFAGAEKINAILKQKEQESIDYEHGLAEEMEAYILYEKEQGEYDSAASLSNLHGSLSSQVSSVYYFGGRYLSFVQQGYDYTGGAHGMPFWEASTYDLQEGEELSLGDILGNSEDEIKALAAEEFTKMYQARPGEYWEDAIDIVQQEINLQSDFYLTKEGLVFYFDPYELAPYAAGTQQIIIPYEKLMIEIPVGEVSVIVPKKEL